LGAISTLASSATREKYRVVGVTLLGPEVEIVDVGDEVFDGVLLWLEDEAFWDPV